MSLSNYAENKVLDHIFRNNEIADWTGFDLYLGLATGMSGSDGVGLTELTVGTDAYARQQITDGTAGTNSFSAAGAATDGTITTDTQITFPSATGDWGTVTHIGIWDASSGGNLIAWGALSVNKTITNGDTFIISSGSLEITLD